MLKLLMALGVVLSLCLPSAKVAQAQATPASCCGAHVLIQLKGAPVTLASGLQTAHQRAHLRVDVHSSSAQTYARDLAAYQDREIAFIRAQGIQLSVRFTFQTIWNGFSADVPDSELGRLRSLANVLSIERTRSYTLKLDRAIPLIHAPEGWAHFGGGPNAGHNMRIAIVDTGIDITNPCFSDAGFSPPPGGPISDTPDNLKDTNNKVIVARAFGDSLTGTYAAEDHVGHGTAVASVAACDYNTHTPDNTTISGVAPDAYLMSYDITPGGSLCASNETIVRALTAAVQDKADVINLSFGGTAGDMMYEKTIVDAVHGAVAAGIPFVSAAGNAGPESESAGSPAIYPEAISVGATTNSRSFFESVTVNGPGAVPVPIQHLRAVPGDFSFTKTVGPVSLVYVGLGRKPGDDAANPSADDFAGQDLTGKIAVIDRGTITFEKKLSHAVALGAVGAIIINNTGHTALIGLAQGSAQIPAVNITQDDGVLLRQWMQSHPDATGSIDPAPAAFDVPPNIVTSFSSRGYGTGLGIKPDLVAPGQDIYMATQSHDSHAAIYSPNGFTVADGTSFSSPFVTGAAALFLQAHPHAPVSEVKAALMGTAAASEVHLDSTGMRPTVLDEGAGLLNVRDLLASTAYLTPSALAFDPANLAYGPAGQDLTTSLTDIGGGSGTWTISVQWLDSNPGVTVSAPSTITLGGGTSTPFAVHMNAGTTTPPGDYDGDIVMTHGAETVHIPFLVHLANQAVTDGSVLLVDNSVSRFQLVGKPADVSGYYTRALDAIGQKWSLWREAQQGPVTYNDLKHAAAVIYYTGANVNDFASSNPNGEATSSPLNEADEVALRQYLVGGGKVFMTGMGATMTGLDTDWLHYVFGASVTTKAGAVRSYSLYDNSKNDQSQKGLLSPPSPSAVPDNPVKNGGPFTGLKSIDFSTQGDGAGDNLAGLSPAAGNSTCPQHGPTLIGVMGMQPTTSYTEPLGSIYGQPALKTAAASIADGPLDVGVVSSDEPSLTHTASYLGRSVLFSFGFEGINDNTGHATRASVMRSIFNWFADKVSVKVARGAFRAGTVSTLKASLTTNAHTKIVQYQWQIGKTTLKPTAKPTTFTFRKAGTYKVRVRVVDSLGHAAVSATKKIRVKTR